MKILVIGRNGQLAQSLAERGGSDVVRAGRPEIDLTVADSARSAILAARPDVVVNAAAFTAVDLAETEEATAHRINAVAAGEIAAAAGEIGTPVIHISTDYVFDGTATTPIPETAPTNPINAYGRTKLAGEEAVRAGSPEHIILRTSWVISPFGTNFVRTIADLGQQRDSLRVVADQLGNPTSAFDIADAILVVARHWETGDHIGFGNTYHVAGSGIATWFDLAVAVQDELSARGAKSAIVNPIATAEWPAPAARPGYSALDTKAFTRDFRYTLPDWRASLGKIVGCLFP